MGHRAQSARSQSNRHMTDHLRHVLPAPLTAKVPEVILVAYLSITKSDIQPELAVTSG